MNRRASCVGTFEVFEAAHVALRTLLAFSQPVNCIFWPIGMLNWLVAASKLHKHRETCCTAEWLFYSFLILWYIYIIVVIVKFDSINASPPYSITLIGKYIIFVETDRMFVMTRKRSLADVWKCLRERPSEKMRHG